MSDDNLEEDLGAPNPDYTDCNGQAWQFAPQPPMMKFVHGYGQLPVVYQPVERHPSPHDLIEPATKAQVRQYAGGAPQTKLLDSASKPRLKFKRVYKSPGYPVDPRAEKARALDGHALTAPRTYDFDASRLKMIDELN